MRMIDMSALNVLIADSNPYMLKIIRTMLRGFGITRIREAQDGAAALELLNSHLIDIVVLDYPLTTLDGVELTELLRSAEDSPNRFVPIIMLSAYTEKRRIEAARDAGVTEFLAKPLCAQDLYIRLVEVIERPRPFVRTPRYFGPDRRRQALPTYSGPKRREQDGAEAAAQEFGIDANVKSAGDLADALFD
jgi:CheY-like chemotaxis protein